MVKHLIAVLIFLLATSAIADMVTGVTKEPRVTETMGLELFWTSTPPDSVEWPSQRLEAWKRWQKLKTDFPGVRSDASYNYFDTLARAFAAILPEPRARFYFYIADTLNVSIWPLSSGYFVVHAGALSVIRDEQLLTFMVILELAHDYLGHTREMSDRANFGAREKKSLVVWPWAALAESDPIGKTTLAYSLEQENDALDVVLYFFTAVGRDYAASALRLPVLLKSLSTKKSASSWPALHANLSEALKQPRNESEEKPAHVGFSVAPNMIAQAVTQIEGSGLQRYPWLRELLTAEPGVLASAYRSTLKANEKRDWVALAQAVKKGLGVSARAEPFLRDQMTLWQQTGKFASCTTQGRKRRWGYFDHLRELMVAQCVFLDGRYTDAKSLLAKYSLRYRYDVHGAFWLTLVDIRLRRPVEDQLSEIEKFWGDRPYVRALRAMRLSILERPSDAVALFNYDSQIAYDNAEWGALDMAHSWMIKNHSSFRERDGKSLDLRERATQRWALGEQVLRHF